MKVRKKLKHFTSSFCQRFKQRLSLEVAFILILVDEFCFKEIALNCCTKSIVTDIDLRRFV